MTKKELFRNKRIDVKTFFLNHSIRNTPKWIIYLLAYILIAGYHIKRYLGIKTDEDRKAQYTIEQEVRRYYGYYAKMVDDLEETRKEQRARGY